MRTSQGSNDGSRDNGLHEHKEHLRCRLCETKTLLFESASCSASILCRTAIVLPRSGR